MEVMEKREKPLKRKLELSILDTFTKLTSPQPKIRIKSSVGLLKQICDNEKDLNYTLNRLIRGVGSSNVNTRSGFYSALVALFSFNNVTIGEVLGIVDRELHKGGNNSKSENADICLGKILVGGAILRSNLYVKCEENEKIRVFQLILDAGKERQYLNLAAYSFVIDFLTRVTDDNFQIISPLIQTEVTRKWSDHTLDTLHLLLVVQEKFPGFLGDLGDFEVMCKTNLKDLAEILTSIPRITSIGHPIYGIFVRNLVKTELTVEFFNELNGILARTNRNKFLVITTLLMKTIEHLENVKELPLLLTDNYVRQMINLFKTNNKIKDKQFQYSCHKLFDILLEKLKNVKNKTKLKIIKKLLFSPGTLIFEKITKSKLIQNITVLLDVKGVKKLTDIYKNVIMSMSDVDEKFLNLDRLYTARLLVKLLNSPIMQLENNWKIEQIKFLLNLSLLKNSSSISVELSENFKETFYSSLNLKLTKLNDLQQILMEIVTELNLNLTNLRCDVSDDTIEIWQKSVKLLGKLQKKQKIDSNLTIVFNILFMQLSLQLFNNTNNKLAIDSLNELFQCYERVKKGAKEGTDCNGEGKEELLWIEVVVDLFLNLLSHNSHLLRNIINLVFPFLCEFLNFNCITQILTVFEPKADLDVLTRNGDCDDSDDNEEEEEEEEESDENEESSEDEEEMDVENEYEDETTNEKLKQALHGVLRKNLNNDSDQESIDLNDLNDEDGEQLDKALAEAFKQYKPLLLEKNNGRQSKKKQNRNDEILTHFRIRVLDLIEIYINSPNVCLVSLLEIMCKLLELYEFTIRDVHQRPLQGRVGVCLKKLCSLRKFTDSTNIEEGQICQLLNSLLGKGTKNAILMQEMTNQICDCCMFLVGISGEDKQSGLAAIFRENLLVFFEKRDCLIPYGLFKNLCQQNWLGSVHLIPDLYNFVFNEEIRPFRRNQALELLKIFYCNHRLLKGFLVEIQSGLNDKQREFVEKVMEFLEDTKVGEVKEKFLCGLFGLVGSMKLSVIGQECDWAGMGVAISGFKGKRTLGTDAKGALNKLCKCLNL